jgi:uncharacterized protein
LGEFGLARSAAVPVYPPEKEFPSPDSGRKNPPGASSAAGDKEKRTMELQERIKLDLKAAMKAKDEPRKSALRVVIGEFGRGERKELTDAEVVAVLRKLIKSERETIEQSGGGDMAFIATLETYLPRMASEDEIRSWISANVDFSAYKNKMQAMRDIMAHFGARADGNTVKTVLQSF